MHIMDEKENNKYSLCKKVQDFVKKCIYLIKSLIYYYNKYVPIGSDINESSA